MQISAESVLALAPDAASAKAANGLTKPGQWPLLGANEAAVWGECQGSSRYQTQVDLSGPSFRCSCPSRKFPCKHGLALLLLWAKNPAQFQASAPPAWVTEWLAERGGMLAATVVGFGNEEQRREAERVLGIEVQGLGGFCEGGPPRVLVFSVPVSVGFQRAEAFLNEAKRRFHGVDWYFGNVYGADGEPMNWWT